MKILDRLPLLPQTRTFHFGDRHGPLLRNEIVVWLSIGLRGERDPQRLSPPFPGLIDSGNNSEFYLHEHHLVHWAGIRPDLLALLASRRVNKREVTSHEADVWIYPNLPRTQDRWPGKTPLRLELEEGIAVGPPVADQSIFPRVPLLGLSALRNNRLDFWFESKTAECHVWTADWRSKIMRLLSVAWISWSGSREQ
jgi:hypothetical protein